MKQQSLADKVDILYDALEYSRLQPYKGNTVADAELLIKRKNHIKKHVEELSKATEYKDATDVLKELVNIVIACVGMANTYGWDFDSAFNRMYLHKMPSSEGSTKNNMYLNDLV